MQGQIANVTQVFSDLWPSVKAHYTPLLTDVAEWSVVAQAFYIRTALTGLHRENTELRAALDARPALPDPTAAYSTQVAAKQGQATQMRETLTSVAREAHDLLKGLQECSLALTVKAQPISAQLQQVSREIQEATDPARLDQLYAQADELETQIQKTKANSAKAKRFIRELHPPLQNSARMMQQLVAEAETQISTMFRVVPAPLEEFVVTKITEDTDSLLQGWQQAVSAFTDLKATAFRRVPELGPLFEQPTEGTQ